MCSPWMLYKIAPLFGKTILRAEHRLSRRRTKTDDDFGTYQFHLYFEPGTARPDLRGAWLLVYPPLAPFLELEMFHRVCNVHRGSVYSSVLQSAIQQSPCGPDKGAACM